MTLIEIPRYRGLISSQQKLLKGRPLPLTEHTEHSLTDTNQQLKTYFSKPWFVINHGFFIFRHACPDGSVFLPIELGT
jgi:hypothetical protein